MNTNNIFSEKLIAFLHDPIDKCFDIKGHVKRAHEYAKVIGISIDREAKGPDMIASCMERSLLPKLPKESQKEIYQNFTEVRHPFSEGRLSVDKFDKDNIFKHIISVYYDVSSVIQKYDDKIKFFYLWRNLQDSIFEKLKNNAKIRDKEWIKYLAVLPADTRVSNHSIWEHLKISSAVKALWDKENKILTQDNSLFLFSIGPVQSFISQARKTQDLFMGSFLLSCLTFKAMEEIIEKYGPTNIIYPDLYGQPLIDAFLIKKELEIINPYLNHIDQPTIPNRFVVIIPETDEDKIKKLAECLENTVKDKWKKIVEIVLKEFKLDSLISSDVIEKQSKNFPEVYWSAIPLKYNSADVTIDDFSEFFENDLINKWKNINNFVNDKGEYPPNIGLLYQLAYSALEKSMGARKNLRNFEQIEELNSKCHLCGEREALMRANKGELRLGKYISSKEGLCVVCFTKRALDKYLEKELGEKFKDFSFPSTAEIASSDFKERALKEAKDEFKQYVQFFNEDNFKDKFKQMVVSALPKVQNLFKDIKDIENIEGLWFFEENLKKEELKEQFGIDIATDNIDKLKLKLKNLTDKIGKPNPYYAIIMLDGDSMGEWLSGEKLPPIEHSYNSETWEKLPDDFKKELKEKTAKEFLTPAIHASISIALRNYSIELVRKIVEEEHLGRLVYSGGDDVLAFVNLKDLFEVMRKLRAGFSGHIKFENGNIEVDWNNDTGFIEKDGKYFLTMGPKASASCGIVIAHYKIPLKLVLDKAREMEKQAKKVHGKDAFGIALMKHSGQVKEFVCKWRFEDSGEFVDTIEELSKLSKYFQKDSMLALSRTFPYKLQNAFLKLKDKSGDISGLDTIFESEIKRLILRSLEGGDEKERRRVIKELLPTFSRLFWYSEIGANINRFINLLEIARFVSNAEN